jgi:hypothetical protein
MGMEGGKIKVRHKLSSLRSMKKSAIRKICELPIAFSRGNKSPFELALKSGFVFIKKKDSLEFIKRNLENQISLIDWWQQWSEDKRTDNGYFLKIGDKNIVGYVDYNKNGLIKEVEYDSELDACSEYILLEVSNILKIRINKKNIRNLKW